MNPDPSQPQSNKNFYGWKMVWALAISTTVAYGVLYYAFAVFVKAMELELGWNRAQTSGAVSLSFVIGALVSPLLGRAVRSCGPGVVPGDRHLQGLAHPRDGLLIGIVRDELEGQLGGQAKYAAAFF